MIKPKILVVDDEPDLLELVRDILESERISVVTADTTDAAMEKVKTARPNLILLDIRIPTIGGLELCRVLKADPATRTIPVIMLTVQTSETDKVIGLGIGADDYITKPFGKRELVARVQAALRRAQYAEPTQQILRAAEIEVDVERHAASMRGKYLDLRPKEFDLLTLLVQKRGKVLTRPYLTEAIMGYEYHGTTRTIDTHIKTLRQKLGPAAHLIETITGVGYRFRDS